MYICAKIAAVDVVNPLAQAYAEKYCSAERPLLQEISAYTYTHHPQAHMLSGHVQGKFLEMISYLQRPRRDGGCQ